MAVGPISEPRANQRLPGVFATWKTLYRQRRQRLRSRSLSQVRFRLSREGYHLIFIIAFILTGAVLRDISLLTLLAASMIGLVLLQWRFCVRAITKLTVTRRVADRTSVDVPIYCRLNVINKKSWLPAWLVFAEDAVQLVEPYQEIKFSAHAIVDEVAPKSETVGTYSISFERRGVYCIGPCKLSTRFPLAIGIGWRTIDIEDLITVHPRIGELLPEFRSLFQNSHEGHHQTAAHVGFHEADFFGLRPWASGDSKRWIHWRTTARLGELSVRQFDRLEQQQVCLLLDLYGSQESLFSRRTEDGSQVLDDACEKAVAFIATIVNKSGSSHAHSLTVGIAAKSSTALTGIQSAITANATLDALSVVAPTEYPDLKGALSKMTAPLLANPHLIVVSTRPQRSSELLECFGQLLGTKASSSLQVTWLNATAGDLERYFKWTSNKSNSSAAG